jgi:hypothetical protein
MVIKEIPDYSDRLFIVTEKRLKFMYLAIIISSILNVHAMEIAKVCKADIEGKTLSRSISSDIEKIVEATAAADIEALKKEQIDLDKKGHLLLEKMHKAIRPICDFRKEKHGNQEVMLPQRTTPFDSKNDPEVIKLYKEFFVELKTYRKKIHDLRESDASVPMQDLKALTELKYYYFKNNATNLRAGAAHCFKEYDNPLYGHHISQISFGGKDVFPTSKAYKEFLDKIEILYLKEDKLENTYAWLYFGSAISGAKNNAGVNLGVEYHDGVKAANFSRKSLFYGGHPHGMITDSDIYSRGANIDSDDAAKATIIAQTSLEEKRSNSEFIKIFNSLDDTELKKAIERNNYFNDVFKDWKWKDPLSDYSYSYL